jgi:hypothetical protein
MRFLLAAVLFASCASAEVVDSASNGFTVKIAMSIKAAPDVVYNKFVHNVGDWWSSDHTFSHDAHNLSIDDRPMGCFCEKLANNGGVRHMEVVYVAPGKAIVLSGGLGPLLSMAATGSMTVDFAAADGGTKLQVSYSVAGYLKDGMNTYAPAVDTVLKEQFTRLKAYVER